MGTERNSCHFEHAVSRKIDAIMFHSLSKISIWRTNFSFIQSKLFVQTSIIDKYNKTISMLFALLYQFEKKNLSIHQNNYSQVLVIMSVKIRIMNKFENFFLFCIALDICDNSSAVILIGESI